VAPHNPPAEGHPTRLAPRHTFAWTLSRASRLLALGVLHWEKEKEWKKMRSDASGAGLDDQCLGDTAERRETLTAWRRLSCCSRSLVEGSRVTRALLAPSGCLCVGQGQRKSEPEPPLLSPARGSPAESTQPCFPACSSLLHTEEPEPFCPRSSPACPSAACSRGAPLPSCRAVFPSTAAPGASPRLTPAACPPTAPSAPVSCRKRGETLSGMAGNFSCPAPALDAAARPQRGPQHRAAASSPAVGPGTTTHSKVQGRNRWARHGGGNFCPRHCHPFFLPSPPPPPPPRSAPSAAPGPGTAVGARWCHVCREERPAVSWRWPPWGPPGHSPVPCLLLGWTLGHPAPRSPGMEPGCPCPAPRAKMAERQSGSQSLSAAWPPPVPPGAGEAASRSSCGPGSAARPRSAPARRR